MQLFSTCGEQGVCRLLPEGAPSCCGAALRPQGSGVWRNSCGALAELLHSDGLFSDQGSNPCLLQWQANSLSPSHKSLIKHSYRDNTKNFYKAVIWKNTQLKKWTGASLVVQWLRLCAHNAGGLDLIPEQGARSHMLQLRVHMLQLRLIKIYIF